MKMLKNNKTLQIFIIGLLLGALFFVIIYGFDVLNVCNDAWLLTGRDLQQHYIGWKFFRNADWSFPIGVHDGLTYPYKVSVLYTDSIPLYAIFFKLLSPVLPQTFQYFGLFGLMCFMLNGGIGSVLVAKFNKSRIFCAFGSVFFILSTPVLQRLFGLLSEDSRHTSLAAHFLILAAIGIWLYKDHFTKRWKAALAFSILGVLCVLIQMYIIFIVGGLMCGYLLHCLLKDRDWKRVGLVFSCFMASSLLTFFLVGGFTDILKATAGGFGIYSANINALVNPFHYSTFLSKKPWHLGQYEGFCYLGLGMILLYAVCLVVILQKVIKLGGVRKTKEILKEKYRNHKAGVISLAIVIIVFWGLALTSTIYLGEKMVVWIYMPDKLLDMLATIRSSGRFMWAIMYFIILFGTYMVSHYIKNKNIQKLIIIICVCLQIADLAKPVMNIHAQYSSVPEEEDIYAEDSFWTTKLGDYKHIVYYPLESCGFYQMLQIGTKASYFDMNMNYFYMSRFYRDSLAKQEDKKNKQIFENNAFSEDTVYITDYKNAHKYKDRCYLYEADNLILAFKNPVEGLKPYNDVYVSKDDPLLEMDFSYNGLATVFAHNGWNMPDYGEEGMWTTKQSVLKLYSGGAKRVHIALEYEAGKKKGTTTIKVNGQKQYEIDNKTSGVAEFDTNLKETVNERTRKGVNWLFLNTNNIFEVKENGREEDRGIFVKKITVTYIE